MPTALITGASMGLGAEYARLCAADGMDLVLVARSRDRLEALATELSAEHGVRAYAVPVDLARPEATDEVVRAVDELGLSIDVLINNAGFGTTGAFISDDRENQLAMVHLNVATVVALTHEFARRMRTRGSGRVLLISSTGAFQPAPGMAVYCATKAFVLSFGDALAYELRGTGVTVTTHCPGATATEFARTSGSTDSLAFRTTSIVASSTSCARDGLRAMKRGRTVVVHGFLNWLGAILARRAPNAIAVRIAARYIGWKGLPKEAGSVPST